MNHTATQIAVVGAGLMGHGIAQIFLAGGHNVALYDPDTETRRAARAKIADIFELLQQDATLVQNLTEHASLEDAVVNADFVVEAGPEKLEVKKTIFAALSAACKPSAILASNTSAIPIGSISTAVSDPSRVIGTHFWNPPYLVRLVEVAQTDSTATAVVDQTMRLLERQAMKPVHLERDIPGFIGNRLQHAMKREAIALIDAGICDAETIDTVVKHGFGARLAVLGPMEQSDLVGLNLTLDIFKVLFPTLDNTAEAPALLANKVARGELGMKTGRGFRDWTEESAEQLRQAMRDHLVQQARKTLSEQ